MLLEVKRIYLIEDTPALNNPPSYNLLSNPEIHISKKYIKVEFLEINTILVYLYIFEVLNIRLRLARGRGLDKTICLHGGNCANILNVICKVIVGPYRSEER